MIQFFDLVFWKAISSVSFCFASLMFFWYSCLCLSSRTGLAGAVRSTIAVVCTGTPLATVLTWVVGTRSLLVLSYRFVDLLANG